MCSNSLLLKIINDYIKSDNKKNTELKIQDNIYKTNLVKNSGCCGAASDAWVPSYPSIKKDSETNSQIKKIKYN